MKYARLKLQMGALCLIASSLVSSAENNIAPEPGSTSRYCQINIPEKPQKTIRLPYQLSFFISPNPNGKEVAVIADFSNRLVNLENLSDGDYLQQGMHDSPLPGYVDPVFTPDGKYITLPDSKFFEYNDAKNNGENAKPIMKGGYGAPYQSIGQVNPKKRQYNYISDPNPVSKKQNIYFTQVKIEKKNFLGIKWEKKVMRKGYVCKNKITGSLPMISPDGKYISYLDQFTQTTKIIRIGKNGKDCKEVLDLGIPTGKVSFNFDENNRQLSFHVERSNYMSGWFSEIEENFSTDAFVFDIDTNNDGRSDESWDIAGIKRLSMTSTPTTGTYYPRFTQDGGIIAARTTLDDEGSPVSNIVQYGPQQINRLQANSTMRVGSNVDHDEFSCPPDSLIAKQYALGKLFSSVCETLHLPDQDKDSILIAPFIDLNSCVELVQDFWEKEWIELNIKNNYANSSTLSSEFDFLDMITKEDLIGICPQQEGKVKKKKSPRLVINQKVQTDAELFEDKCASCHEPTSAKGGIVFFKDDGLGNWSENPEAHNNYSGLDNIVARNSILSLLKTTDEVRNVMPPTEVVINRKEKQRIAQYLMKYVTDDDTKLELQKVIDEYPLN